MLQRADRWLASRPRGVLCGLGLTLVALVGTCDHVTGFEMSLSLFYLLPIGLGAWYLSGLAGVCLSLVSGAVWVTVDLTSGHVYSEGWIPFWNGGVRLGFFLITTGLLVAVRREMRQIERVSRVDPLTGALNGRAFREESERLLALCSRKSLPVTVAFLDLDDFKQVNDRAGHAEGDRVLAEVASAFRAAVRRHDVVGRLGGDEFALLLPGADRDQALPVLRRLGEAVSRVTTVGDQRVSCSIGALTFATPPAILDEALAEADSLMYLVKSRGKGTFLHEGRA